MKKSKSVMAGLLVFCLLVLLSSAEIFAEEEYDPEEEYLEEEEETEPIPESYYYPIESNDTEGWPEGPAIEAASAVVMDLDTGTFLYSKQATEKQYPASITKIMTTLLLIENCDLNSEITFSEIVTDLEEGSSNIGIQAGETMTLYDSAYAIMLASANDVANGVAEYIAGSISGFADLMNEKAAELGCVNTHFSNPHGLYSDDHYTCAYDMALIAQAAYDNETFRDIVSTREYTIPETNLNEEERVLTNHHQMISPSSDYYQEWCTGGKTGYTSQCLNTLVTFSEKNDMRLVCVILRVNGSGKAYDETTQILNYSYDNFYEENYHRKNSGDTFYDIMGLGYVGTAERHLSEAWKTEPFEKGSVHITLPNTASTDELSYTVADDSASTRTFTFTFNDWPVGTGTGKLNTPFVPIQAALQVGAEATEENISSSGGSKEMEGMDEALDQTVGFLESGYHSFMDYAQNHAALVLIVGALLIIFLIVLIIVLIFRCTSDARIRRKRRLEEEEMERKEAEIDQMTTDEIEAELREAMKEEERRKEEEEKAKAEKEKAAQEAEEMERKAKETEELIDELERERQERLAAEAKEGKNK